MTMTPQTGKLLMLFVNLVFLIWAYRILMSQYKDESQYQGSMGMLYKYFREMQDAVNRTGEGNRQLMKMGLNFIGVPLAYTLFSNWIEQRSLTSSLWSIFGNLLILILFGLLFIFSYRMIRLNEFYPDRWGQKRSWFKKLGRNAGELVASKNIFSDWEQTVVTLANEADEHPYGTSHDWKIKQQIQQLTSAGLTQRTEIAQVIDLQQHLSSPVEYSQEERMMLALYFNQVDEMIDVMAEMYDAKSDEEKHQEYLSSKHTQQVTFILIAVCVLLPSFL